MTIWLALGALALVCALGAASRFPVAATALWICAIESTPDLWLPGAHETMIGAEKGAGVVLVILLGFRLGWRVDGYNPGFAFAAMFAAGLLHGLYPGLTVLSSLRSLVGSAAPFAFGFIKPTPRFRQVVVLSVTLGPLVNLAVGGMLDLLHLHAIANFEGGSLRLAGAGLPAFLGGFALIAIYAGLMQQLCPPAAPPAGRRFETGLLAVNFAILLLAGARTPLALAALLGLGVLALQRRLSVLAACGAILALATLFLSRFHFIRIVDLVELGQAGNLSNRNLIWPYFQAAIAASPWIGWGAGAGKMVVPPSHGIAQLIGTNAAHNEYLRIGCEGGLLGVALLVLLMGLWAYHGARALPPPQRWLLWVVFIAFAVHSATDNTLIATTSSAMFIWTAALFRHPSDEA